MAKIKVSLLGSLFLLAGTLAAWAGTGVVVGDSLGVGVSMASHLRSFAKNSVSIRATGATDQIERAPEGSTVFLSLGTNDAVGNIDGLSGGIQRVVSAATRAKVHLVWMGPPCVFKPWNKNAETLDGELKSALSGTSVTYVSMHDPRLCDRAIRARDGVHFSMTGYNYMWKKARDAAGFVAEAGNATAAAAAATTTTGAADQPTGATKAKARKAKHVRKKKATRRRRARAAAPAAPAAPAVPAASAPAAPANPQ